MSHKCPPVLKLQSSYFHSAGPERLKGVTVGQLVDQAAELWGDVDAVVDVYEGVRLTFSQVRQQVDKLASGFLAIGLKRKDLIGILSPNSYQWYITFLAAARAGLILVSLNYASQSSELTYFLNKVPVKALICADKYRSECLYDLLVKVVPEITFSSPGCIQSKTVPSLKTVIFVSRTKYPGSYLLEEVAACGNTNQLAQIQELQNLIQFDEPFNIQFTSGSTGNPKGAVLSHHAMVNNSYMIGQRRGYIPGSDRFCFTVPMFHGFGCIAVLTCSIQFGATCVIPSPLFNAAAALVAVEKERCTVMFGTPTMYVDMVKVQESDPLDVSSLRIAGVGSAPCVKDLLIKIKEKLGVGIVYNGYGMTETNCTFLAFENDTIEKITSTVGFPLDHMEIKVVDPEGNVVPIGTPGELCVRGYVNMLGYWEDEEKTSEAVQDGGWFHTGDCFILHEDGYGSIVGRLKEIIIRGGENIAPKEIEEILCSHPDVTDAQVVGVPDERLGEQVCAWIKLKDGSHLCEKELRDFCAGKLSYYKIPCYVFFATNFPKTSTGKVHKLTLAKKAEKLIVNEK